jgi:hypothetical protein
LTPGRPLDLPTTTAEFRAERLGVALRGLAADLVAERQKVAELRREVAVLRSQLASLTSTPRADEVVPGAAADRRA